MFDAVFFDLDGTLIDTERLAMSATVAAFAAMGYRADQDFLHDLVGKDMPTGERLIAARYPQLNLKDLDRRVAFAMNEALLAGMPLKAGVRHLQWLQRAALHFRKVQEIDGPLWNGLLKWHG